MTARVDPPRIDWVDRQLAGTPHTTLIEEILASSAYAARIARG